MVIFAVLTVFWLFLTIGTPLVHCLYSLGRPVTICTPMVLSVFDDWYSVPFVKNSQKAVKTAQKWPLVYQSSHVYQDCTNRVPTVYQKQPKDNQNSKNDHWCTNRHMSTQSPPNTQSRTMPLPCETVSVSIELTPVYIHFHTHHTAHNSYIAVCLSVCLSVTLWCHMSTWVWVWCRTRGQSNLTKSSSRGVHSPVTGHPRGSKFVPLNSWGRVSY